MSHWNASQYLKFASERTQPAFDLANRIYFDSPKKIIDIGCGPGNSTHVLSQQFAGAYIVGIDNSADMIETAKKTYPGLDFQLCDVSKDLSTIDHDFDIVFSNACIQWIPHHDQLIKGLMGLLKSKGVLAIQTPINNREPVHRIIREVATSEKWQPHLPSPRVFYNKTPEEYYDLLAEISSDFTMWETTYYHRMPSHQAIMEWVRGTGLRPYLNALCDEHKPLFEQDIYNRLTEEYPMQKNKEIIYRFPRLFFVAISK